MYCRCDQPVIDLDTDEGCRRCGRPIDFGELGSLNVAATEPEHGHQLDEAPPPSYWPKKNDRRTYGWRTCGCGERFPDAEAFREHVDRVHVGQ